MKPQPQFEHTDKLSSRRRALFPTDENSRSDSDLGCISPLNFDSDCIIPLKRCVGDYDIIGLVDRNNLINTPENTPTPTFSTLQSKALTPSTVLVESPTQKLKTPHDITHNTKLPKLPRKTGHDPDFLEDSQLLTLLSVDNSNSKNSKVRTALFPELDMSFPSRKFYPQNEPQTSPVKHGAVIKLTHKRPLSRNNRLYLCSRNRFKTGQINAGVRHKIKKRKGNKKLARHVALKATISIIENSPLNGVLNVPNKELTSESILPKEPSPEPDSSKKFFKSSRHRGVVTMNENIRLELNNGKMSLMPGKNSLKRPKPQDNKELKRAKLDVPVFDSEKNDPLISSQEIKGILQTLEDKENTMLMSPTSQMCNMTSGLALNSPKKAKNLNGVLESMPPPSGGKNKLFPIFYAPNNPSVSSPKVEPSKNPPKKFRNISKDQMLLDAGQKRWGVTQCPECKIIYHMGDPGDEIMHVNYHNAEHIFRFNGWKNERVVSNTLLDGRIVQIVPGDSKIWWKKVKDVIEVVNRDLGFYDMEFHSLNSQIFFCIKNKVIVGVLVAEVKKTAHKLLTTHKHQVDLCSEESYSIKCGVSRIWVSQNYRKKGVATSLMDCLKRNFIMGHIMNNSDIALSSPTEAGKIFGQSYFKTPNFLIYFV